ncbi:hypothetical protein AMTRI_Chr02g219590 [Amborella trichopoda]|uniref:Uncharacterized protein n=1 Tax=Amborella trichopoda TaxID=13333 RepID=W1P8M5_AMBTC|nr:hypothetical protein AMTR_s00003p00242280 [Amborella trichopoda]
MELWRLLELNQQGIEKEVETRKLEAAGDARRPKIIPIDSIHWASKLELAMAGSFCPPVYDLSLFEDWAMRAWKYKVVSRTILYNITLIFFGSLEYVDRMRDNSSGG